MLKGWQFKCTAQCCWLIQPSLILPASCNSPPHHHLTMQSHCTSNVGQILFGLIKKPPQGEGQGRRPLETPPPIPAELADNHFLAKLEMSENAIKGNAFQEDYCGLLASSHSLSSFIILAPYRFNNEMTRNVLMMEQFLWSAEKTASAFPVYQLIIDATETARTLFFFYYKEEKRLNIFANRRGIISSWPWKVCLRVCIVLYNARACADTHRQHILFFSSHHYLCQAGHCCEIVTLISDFYFQSVIY